MVVRKRVSQQIVDEIKNKIRTGEFPLNSKLPSENELAEMFNVSRVPVREALSALSSHGIIESVHGGGSWVQPKPFEQLLDQSLIEVISFEQLIELLETRIMLETKAASLAALRHDDNDLDKMYDAQEMLFKELYELDKKSDEADSLFHQSILYSTNNGVLIKVSERLSDIYKQALQVSFTLDRMKENKKQIYEEHQSILRAISLRDREDAENQMYKHLANSLEKLKQSKIE